MKIKSKAILLVLSAVLLVAASVFGTLAYLTSEDSVTNTFTVGNVQIKLDEADVDDSTPGKDRDTENKYHLIPGGDYVKDPTVTVKAKSDDAFVRAIVTVTFENVLTDAILATDLDTIITGYSNNWVRQSKEVTTEEKTVNAEDEETKVDYTVITYEYRYAGTGDKGEVPYSEADTELDAIFTGISVPEIWGNDELAAVGGFEVGVVAHAIQAAGFDTADAAWAAFDAQN